MKSSKGSSITAEEIRQSYFQSTSSSTSSQLTRPTPELTTSTKFVVREAKKWIGTNLEQLPEYAEEQGLLEIVKKIEVSKGEQLSQIERTAAVAAIRSSLEHYDVLSPLVSNPEVNDIIVRGYADVSIQVGRKNIQTDVRFPDLESYKSFIENLLKRAGKACTLATPVVDAATDPDVRVCVTHESFSPPGTGPMITLRIARHGVISLARLENYGLAPDVVLAYLAAVVKAGVGSILIAGEVGTGKTTLVRALASQIQDDQSVLVIEDTHEIVLERKFVRTLLTREANTEGAGRISPAQAIRTGMRMAMNRIILGEMRDAEAAEAFIDVSASGHPGMSTIHARTARDALGRLELFLLRAQGNVGIDTVRRQIANAISVVVFLEAEPGTGNRRIRTVLEVGGAADGEIQVSPLFILRRTKDYSGDSQVYWERDSGVSLFQEELRADGVLLPGVGSRLLAKQGSGGTYVC